MMRSDASKGGSRDEDSAFGGWTRPGVELGPRTFVKLWSNAGFDRSNAMYLPAAA